MNKMDETNLHSVRTKHTNHPGATEPQQATAIVHKKDGSGILRAARITSAIVNKRW